MKQLCCVLLALCLLAAVPGVGAGAEEMTVFESRFGFSLWYSQAQLECWTEYWEGAVAECFCPVEDHSGVAVMVCRGSRYSALLWEDQARVTIDEPEAALDYPFEVTVYTDGETVTEQWIVSAADADQVFIIQYEEGDPQHWADLFHAVLETVEFPFLPAENASFRLDFFQGGAAGMHFEDVTLDSEAEPIVIMPLEEVTNFSLELLDWDWETWEADNRAVYSADRLDPGDNLRVYVYIPDILPNLRLRYTNGQGFEEWWYISQSGRDGSLLLLGEDEL